jgi:hypothetical protein
MITYFNIFLNEKNLIDFDLNYDEALYFNDMEHDIKSYFFNKYIDYIGVLGKYNSSLTKTSIKKILKFANKNNDKELENLVLKYLEEIEIKRNIKKYNL